MRSDKELSGLLPENDIDPDEFGYDYDYEDYEEDEDDEDDEDEDDDWYDDYSEREFTPAE